MEKSILKNYLSPKPTKHKYTAPANDIESAIVKIWESVLDVKPVGINDNFYRLGGDSIKAIRIVSLLQMKASSVIRETS